MVVDSNSLLVGDSNSLLVGDSNSLMVGDSNSLMVGIVCTVGGSFNFVGASGFALITSWLEDTASTYAQKYELRLSYRAKNKLQVRYLHSSSHLTTTSSKFIPS
jgi:hypothetical protein